MTYAIRVLSDRIQEHQKSIDRLENVEPEMNAEQVFIDNDIREHKTRITELQEAIRKLM
jgi:hypothetical protein